MTTTTTPARPAFGDVYVAAGSAYLTHSAAAVRVVGWTAKHAIVERLPLTTIDTLVCPVEHSTSSSIDWARVPPLPAAPRTRTGPHERMRILVYDDTGVLELVAPSEWGARFAQHFERCAEPATWRGATCRYS
jgi:hypothetical protein